MPLRWRPEGVGAGEWFDSTQRQRAAIFAASLPEIAELSPGRIDQFVHEASWDPDYRQEVLDDIARTRGHQDLHAMQRHDPVGYNKRLGAMTETERADYDRWERIWSELNSKEYLEEQSRLTTAAKGLPSWENIFALSLDDAADDSEYQKTLDQMDAEEQRSYYEWEIAQSNRMSTFSTRLYELFEKGEREQHWDIYSQLTPAERLYYDRWMALELLERSPARLDNIYNNPSMVHANNLVDDVYDVWLHTGEDESLAWNSYVHHYASALTYNQGGINRDYAPIGSPNAFAQVRRIHHILQVRKNADMLSLDITSSELQRVPLMALVDQFKGIQTLEGKGGAQEQALAELPEELRRAYGKWVNNPNGITSARARGPRASRLPTRVRPPHHERAAAKREAAARTRANASLMMPELPLLQMPRRAAPGTDLSKIVK